MESDPSSGDLRPYATEEDVRRLLKSLYGMQLLNIRQLNGYDDQNFHVTVDQCNDNSNVTKVAPQGYVFKILNIRDSTEEKDHLRAQIGMLQHVAKFGILCPQHVPDKDGNFFTEQPIPNKTRTGYNQHVVRLLEYIEGTILASVPLTDELIVEGATFLAEFQQALKGFSDSRLRRDEYLWNITNVSRLEPFVSSLDDEENRAISLDLIAKWKEIQPKFQSLPFGPVHSDFNEQNIIVSRSYTSSYHVKAILDFQDSSYGYIIYDLAVYMMYMLTISGDKDPITVGRLCLRGYLSKQSLTQAELDVLYYCVIGRFLQSLILGYYYFSIHKDPYLLVTQEPGWKALRKLISIPAEETLKLWLQDEK